jgi:rhomboid family GlyGly-CTERM serine protease
MEVEKRRLPRVTGCVILLATALWAAPARIQALAVYDRGEILRGQAWRLLTGHFVHFSASHLAWNLLAAAVVGAWIECSGFPRAGWLLAAAPLGIGAALLVMDPGLERYGGLSGAATAAAAFACASEWRLESGPRRFLWIAALTLVGAKVAWEFVQGGSVFTRFGETGVRNTPLAHAAGLAIGCLVGFAGRKRTLANGPGPAIL